VSTKNDKAWAKYCEAKNIVFDQPSYFVDASELKEKSGREPRLLAKFDTPEQLPKVFKDAGYTLVPIKNGQYQIVRGDLFVHLPQCLIALNFQPTSPFPLLTAGRGSGESQYIDYAFNTGLLKHFLSLNDMYLTIRGREHTGHFEFEILAQHIVVNSVQIEVDAGYEAIRDIVLIEAKIGVPHYFNIRQMYYPYRRFSALVPQKRIRNLFLAYDIPSSSYHLFEYVFYELNKPSSIAVANCAIYKIASSIHLTIHALTDVRFQTDSQVVPQADDLNKVVELLIIVNSGLNNAEDVAEHFSFEKRQSSYYREAAEYLGLLSHNKETDYFVTEQGQALLSEPINTQSQFLAKSVVNSWVFIQLIQSAGLQGSFTNNDIDQVISTARKDNGTQRYTGETVPRRRQTIVAWIKWMAQEIGCFVVYGMQYHLR